MDKETFIRAVLESNFTGFKDEIIEAAVKNIMAYVDEIKPVKSKWLIDSRRTVMHCRACGWAFEYYSGLEEEWNFCPHCGV